MPYIIKKSGYKRVNRRRYKRKTGALATVPRMMPKSLAFKRSNQVSTRVMWFKYNAILQAEGSSFREWRGNGGELLGIGQFQSACGLYDQYKLLGFTLRLFPANIGTEPQNQLNRGNHILWTDQRRDSALPDPTGINQIINTASARMINPRRPYRISLFRPRGQPEWGACVNLPPPFPPSPDAKIDPWDGSINHFYQDATDSPDAHTLFFYTIQYKVVFRGRRQDT